MFTCTPSQRLLNINIGAKSLTNSHTDHIIIAAVYTGFQNACPLHTRFERCT